MATKKDLVEAHAFSRRRLVTAFVSGAPGGREVEPVRPGRVLIGGVALSVLLLAGAAIAGFLLGRPPAQWLDKGSFVISKDTGEQYVVLRGGDDPELQRVPNYVSAQLLLGDAELTPYTVRDKYIRGVPLGPDLGIEGAPAGLPAAEDLVDDGWTACTAADTGIQLAVQSRPGVEDLAGSAFLVSSDGEQWLIATQPPVGTDRGQAFRFPMPADATQASTLGVALGFGATPVEVDPDWLNLFPPGDPLEAASFGVDATGQPVTYSGGDVDLSAYSIGDLLVTTAGDFFLLGDEGPQQLSPFAGLLYGIVGGQASEIPGRPSAQFDDPDTPPEWPGSVPTAVGTGALCAVLHPEVGQEPEVTLATNPTGAADPSGIDRGSHEVDVDPSGGAYVLSGAGEGADDGTRYVIDTKGSKYALVGSAVPGYIGYGDVQPPQVWSAWLGFFDPGVSLSTNKARRLPEDAPQPDDASADGGS